jgi:hypothetical protein
VALVLLAGSGSPGQAQDHRDAWSHSIRVAGRVRPNELRAAPDTNVHEVAQPTPLAAAEAESVRTVNDRLKPISEVRTGLEPREAVYPIDYAASKFAEADAQAAELVVQRTWVSRLHTWDATAFCHRPLYFEDENLERHGRSFGVLQPAVSAGHFAGHFLAWPYLAGATPPRRCVYNLGHEPPGSYTPYSVVRPPLSLRGALFEAGAIVAVPLIVP